MRAIRSLIQGLAVGILAATTLSAAVIQGTVVERVTGRPLARTRIYLKPVPNGVAAQQRTAETRTGRSGEFQFLGIGPGRYTVVAERLGYFPAESGQRRPTGYGLPFEVTEEQEVFVPLQMGRKATITGTVWDENLVGIPGVPVVAYRAEIPLRLAGQTFTDDRGEYRLAGLEAGNYWVRTDSHVLEDGAGLQPTFARQGEELYEARIYPAEFDRDTVLADIIPGEGRLYSVSGSVSCGELGVSIAVTLSSESGRKKTTTACGGGFQFEGIMLGRHQLYAEFTGGELVGGAFAEINVARNFEENLIVTEATRIRFVEENGGPLNPGEVTLTARRDDLSGLGDEVLIDLNDPRLPPGRWLLQGQARNGRYIAMIGSQIPTGGQRFAPGGLPLSPIEGFPVRIDAGRNNGIRLTVASPAAELNGIVRNREEIVPGAPVSLLPTGDALSRQAGGMQQTVANEEGRFQFENLPPGSYRILATFDEREPTIATFDEARASSIQVEGETSDELELELWVAP